MDRKDLKQIYVAVLDGGNDAWRRVDALCREGDTYEIVSVNEHPHERWEYATGECVRCRAMTMPDGERVLVATQRSRTGRDRSGES